MPKYLIQANYSVDGTKGVLKEGGTGRRQAVAKLIESLGGRLESFYFCFGMYDAVVIADLPDNTAVAAASLAVGATGGAEVQTTALLTPEEIDEATKRHPDYRRPGG